MNCFWRIQFNERNRNTRKSFNTKLEEIELMLMLPKGRQWLLSVAIPPWKEPVSYDPGSKARPGLLVLELEARTFQWMLFRLESEEASIMCQSMKTEWITCQKQTWPKQCPASLGLHSRLVKSVSKRLTTMWFSSGDKSCSGCTAANFISGKEGDPLQVFTISCLNCFFPRWLNFAQKNPQYGSPKPAK